MGIKLARKEYVDKETNYSQVYNDWGLKGFVKKCKGMTIVHVEGVLNNNTSSAGDAYPIITFSNSLVACPHVIGYAFISSNTIIISDRNSLGTQDRAYINLVCRLNN